MSWIPPRAIGGVLLVCGIVTVGVLFSPAATVSFLESVAGDPVQFSLVVAGLYLVRPLFAWPTTPLALVVGYGFGVALGVPIALVGVIVTVTPVFVAARWFVSDPNDSSLAELPFGGAIDRTATAICQYYRTAGQIRGVAVSRLAPIPSDISTCAAAVSGVSYPKFVLGTVLGELPWTVAAVIVGSSAATVRTDGLGELGLFLTAGCLIAVVVLLAGPAYQTIQSRSTDAR
ncbi:VTT domain-containing protein [Halostagnicola sp. A-GB9-2]|uniref:TVP38/TMEM64 family protein n=1 Tax=Halostagnicola sp. A-GB9-2 TaxID=3048066 RepID=UPI0024BF7534|nr:VTT domain-containing protein [Halostagnicola sp. A-GB9-2]MDJ1431483.1 VTT domain-containing protein [Halostagnicola sp. A-GB9-2]